MTESTQLHRIRELHALALRDRGPTGGFPPELQALVGTYVLEQRARGCSWDAAAKPLPVSSTTARRWALRQERRQASALVPVTLVDDEPSAAASSTTSELCLTSPGGFRLTGLSLGQAAHLLGQLG